MEQIFVVVPLDPPVERQGRLCHWGSLNRLTGRIWRSSYRVTQFGAEMKCLALNREFEASSSSRGSLSATPGGSAKVTLH